MKAKIAPQKEIVLLYHHEQAQNGQKLPAVLDEMKIEYRLLKEEDLDKTTGELAGYRPAVTEKTQEQKEYPQIAAMAIGGIAGTRLDRLLNAMKQQEIDIPVKMVITRHNENWKFADLIHEVSKEHELFLAMERLQKLTEILKGADDPKMKEIMTQAKTALSRMNGREEQQPTAEELDEISAKLTACLQK